MVVNKKRETVQRICSLIPSTDFHKAGLLANISQAEGADYVEIHIPLTESPLSPDFLSKTSIKSILVIDAQKIMAQTKAKTPRQEIQQNYQAFIHQLINFQPHAIEIDWDLLSKPLVRDSAEKMRKERIRFILSKYYEYFPPKNDLLQTIKKMEEFDPDIIKVVAPANNFYDSLTMLSLYHELESINLLAICSGEKGKLSQIIAPFLGAEFTYGYLSRKTGVARIRLKQLKKNIETLASSFEDY
ncbi:MAG: type I 3-dehydroquinate dehydratase [Candidatus Heimdallarchaeota archaeon]|nr:type I 3-dehydroquinate dehydratase [Candidatus Heimdallarchaeota archaeon]